MGLPKRIEKFVSIFLVLMICVFGIQLVQHQQYAFFAWEEKGEIPVENQVDRHVFNLDNELLGATIFDLNRVNLENLSANSKKTGCSAVQLTAFRWCSAWSICMRFRERSPATEAFGFRRFIALSFLISIIRTGRNTPILLIFLLKTT